MSLRQQALCMASVEAEAAADPIAYARAQRFGGFLDALGQPGPNAAWLANVSGNLARIRAEREQEQSA